MSLPRTRRAVTLPRDTTPGPVARAVREAVGALVSPAVQERVVQLALDAEGQSAVPEVGQSLRRFVGSLQSALERTVGSDVATAVVADIMRIVALADREEDTHVRRTSGSPATTAGRTRSTNDPTETPAPPSESHVRDRAKTIEEPVPSDWMALDDAFQPATLRPGDPSMANAAHAFSTLRPTKPNAIEPVQLIIATRDTSATDRMESLLTNVVTIHEALDAFALAEAVSMCSGQRVLLVVDCRMPSVHIATVLAVVADLPISSSIVLWGASPEVEAEAMSLGHLAVDWVRCGAEGTADDVAALCRALSG